MNPCCCELELHGDSFVIGLYSQDDARVVYTVMMRMNGCTYDEH